MSHTTTIKSVPIRDIEAVRTAVQSLKEQGINCELRENEQPRMYYGNQYGQCEYVVRLNDCRYDLGLKKNKEGTYDMVCDLWAGDVRGQVGCRCDVKGASDIEKSVGRFSQEYSKAAAINAAVNEGYSVGDSYIDDEGNAQVELLVL